MKRLAIIFYLLLVGFTAAFAQIQFLVTNDMGRNGYYEQKPIAELMGRMAEENDFEAVLALGDVHHFMGVESVTDPLWMTNYELMYSHPELQIPWYPILGNHEYRGNTQAVLDYSKVSRRWQMPARYYSKVFADDSTSLRIVFLDTTPLIDKYHQDTEDYPSVRKQKIQKQLVWLEKELAQAKEDWVVVVGHHPIYAETSKDESERMDMQNTLGKVLRKHKQVAMYLCGHIHNFQHIRVPDSSIDYVVNSSASLSRKVKPIEGTQFCSPETGFSVIAADKNELCLHMVDKKGNLLYSVKRTK